MLSALAIVVAVLVAYYIGYKHGMRNMLAFAEKTIENWDGWGNWNS